eukprot:CAMPEP_0118720172 /NCGR_PEP_ID=MMETSP0800-20121206/29951_1 /TAXON_ID=210618 ORGANISM="Striatella unipunctata, Strain CCMP2910" /NCGR_SAMPLE_ID=MMETSP0800 /ASSEMBLY_ACC=CAM_ASM_000638 /LENGTH=223 /DNA_ID=CAMNT_0006627759 /DNA_START=231 /DNA_END=902 /DNA_ORIENTATION=-
MQRTPVEGIQLVVDPETGVPGNLGEIMAEIEGPQGTPYESKYFHLKIVFSADFPASPPRAFFMTKIFHPNVDMTTGAVCVNTLKKDWTPTTSLSHVFGVVRCLLIVPFPESSLNDEAGKLFMCSYEEFSRRARIIAGIHGRNGSQHRREDLKETTAANEGTILTDVTSSNNGDDPSGKSTSSSPNGLSESTRQPLGGRDSVRTSGTAKSVKGKTTKKKGLKRL